MENLRYPIGRFTAPEHYNHQTVRSAIEEIKSLPHRFEKMARSLSDVQLEEKYRPEGWTARQVIHHVADSHVNAYIRFKWTLTEEKPRIKAYNEAAWASLSDSRLGAIDPPLSFLHAIHGRWVQLLDLMDESDFAKQYQHPDNDQYFPLWVVCSLYAWHGNHHLAHLELIKQSGTW